MRKQIAAANWKMNLTAEQANTLMDDLLASEHSLNENQLAIFAVPFPYLQMIQKKLGEKPNVFVAAQNCNVNKNGAYTGEVSAEMLNSLGIQYVILGHSERREYNHESNEELARKIDMALSKDLKPIFCCGEALAVRDEDGQNEWVTQQLQESLFHLSAHEINGFIIAYEPIWAIGTGRTASSDQAQEMHAHIRSVFAEKYGRETADSISILYGGSVKAANAKEIFGKPDVDGGLVGGASLNAAEFSTIINSLK